MSVLTPLLLRGLTGLTRQLLVLWAQMDSKPPQEQLGVTDVTTGLTSCFLCFFLSSGWVLSHLETYKKRE
ncbi:cytochrome c oxidase subunit 8A, mitochondrial-like [Callorhinus ursinus]|uniref:Cytochrome c oxidase subunit 8 n=1 Tax=Callorhinus ursinus TaxID=34884 RepID=A0A3Q7QVW6_CALUR|nr:cytochrome c oxidase subunit 8A, mitochondrial-like [Callorhinus ursinus]